MINVNALGDACPIPVVKTKNAIRELNGAGVVETLVDNEIAVQNLTKMAEQKGYGVRWAKLSDKRFAVTMTVGGADACEASGADDDIPACAVLPEPVRNTVVVISSDKMGDGSDELGKTLMKGFIYALSRGDTLPSAMLFYNGGAHMTCAGSPSLDDIRSLCERGVEILTCGTCLNFYGLSDKLGVGEVTNMYSIAEKLMSAGLIVKP